MSRRIQFIAALAAIFPLSTLFSCSSGPPANADGPAWIHSQARTVDGGYIVYVGSGDDQVEQRAAFKAEGMALQDLANECSFTPKGVRVEDHFVRNNGLVYQAYAKVAVDFQTCEEAKKALDADAIKKLANVALTDDVKRYQEMMNEPPPPPIQVASAANVGPPAPGQAYYGPPVIFVRDQPTFYVVRQQVAWAKETVILTPAGPGGVVVVGPQLAVIAGPSRQIREYEFANPVLRTSQPVWSQARLTVPAYMGGGPLRPGFAGPRGYARPGPVDRAVRRKRRRWN